MLRSNRISPRIPSHLAAVAAIVAAVLPPVGAPLAEERDRWVEPDRSAVEEALPEGARLTGREIYDRFLRNRHRRSAQRLRVVSRDPGGNDQTTHFHTKLEDLRDDDDEAVGGVLTKLFVEVTAPFDMRHTRYLFIARDPGPDDEFIYQPSLRRARRARLKSLPLMGTDYTFDDFAYHDLEGAEYERLPDAEIDGVPVYVIEATLDETRTVEHYRTVSFLEKEHYIPLRIHYWDRHGVELRRLDVPHQSIEAFGDLWIATESTMTNLLQRTKSSLYVEDVETDPDFHEKVFSVNELSKGL